jgi:small ligand-binding sensory domain FIST
LVTACPNHDINTFRRTIGPVATAGSFCNSKNGPIGERLFVHGSTSVISRFTEPELER